ncbi:MAG: LON peptidase substrate-binding domain-containing protein [Candidatus Aminicenantes bacterium]|nr:LON peptidase substrate-binding domain-containing protein [Candidatus Aminicenantes bacterium]
MAEPSEPTEIIRNVPLIPLRELVIFPSTLVPFIIGRSSSIQALEKADETDKLIFLSAQIDPSMDNPGSKDIYSLGVIAKIIRTVRQDDKNIKVIVEGKKRAQIVEFLSTSPFYQVLAKEVKDIEDNGLEIRELLKRVLALFEDYLKFSQNVNFQTIMPALRDHSPDRIADIIASHLFLRLEEKQKVLETLNVGERIRRLNFILENEILNMQAKVK